MTYSGTLIHKNLNRALTTALFVFVVCAVINAQQNPVNESNKAELEQDSTTYVAPKRNTFSVIFSGKPGKAALYSFVFPSGGQIYNKRWLKVPLALGVDGYFLYNLLNKQKEYTKYNDIVNIYNAGGTYPDVTEQSALNFRAAARTNREYAWVYLIVGHLVTVFDAYVDRHLMDFDISPDLTLTGNNSAGISIVIPLNRSKKMKVLPSVLAMP
jgi:hypothetical protein